MNINNKWAIKKRTLLQNLTFLQERLNEYKRLHTAGKSLGIESHVLSAEESKELYLSLIHI